MKTKGRRQSKRVEKAKPLSASKAQAADIARTSTGVSAVPKELVDEVEKAIATNNYPTKAEQREIEAESLRKQANRERKVDREMLKRTPRKLRDKASKDLNSALKQIKKSPKASFFLPRRIGQ